MPENDEIAVEREDTERVSPDKRGRPAVRHSESGERLPEDGFIHAPSSRPARRSKNAGRELMARCSVSWVSRKKCLSGVCLCGSGGRRGDALRSVCVPAREAKRHESGERSREAGIIMQKGWRCERA
jgi:hypothetical protein